MYRFKHSWLLAINIFLNLDLFIFFLLFFKIGCLVKNLGLTFDTWFNLPIVKLSKHYKAKQTREYLMKIWNRIDKTSYKIETLYYFQSKKSSFHAISSKKNRNIRKVIF